jgi:hypothetical protein
MISIRDMFSMSEACIDRRVHDACDTRLEMLGLSINSDLKSSNFDTSIRLLFHISFRRALLQEGI